MERNRIIKNNHIHRNLFGIIIFPAILFFTIPGTSTLKAQEYVRPQYELPEGQSNASGRFAISFSAGVAVPLGDFGSTNVKNSFWDFNSPDSTRLQGFASPGYQFNLSIWYRINDFMGVQLGYNGNSNPVNLNGFSNAVGYAGSSDESSYFTAEYLAGLYFFEQGNKLTFKASAMIGLATNTYPTLTIQYNDTTTYTRRMDNGGSGFAYSFTGQMEYSFTDRLSLLLSTTYSGSTISYDSWTESWSIIGKYYIYYIPPYHHTHDVTLMNTGILKLSVGLLLKL